MNATDLSAVERQARIEWDKSPAIQAEFRDFDKWHAYVKAGAAAMAKYHQSPAPQAEFGDLVTYLAYIRGSLTGRITGRHAYVPTAA